MTTPEKPRVRAGLEALVREDIDAALRTFRASCFEARLRGRIEAETAGPGRIRRRRLRPALAWTGLALILCSVVSIGVWLRSRAVRPGTGFDAIEAVLAGGPLLRPRPEAEPPDRFRQAASPGGLERIIAGTLGPLVQARSAAAPGGRVAPALRPVSADELDRKIGDLILGHKLELFFSDYLKKEEDV